MVMATESIGGDCVMKQMVQKDQRRAVELNALLQTVGDMRDAVREHERVGDRFVQFAGRHAARPPQQQAPGSAR